MNKRVVLGMSGGVDSSVAAYLLKQQGYKVIGLFMRNWDSNLNSDFLGNKNRGDICPQEQDYNDAKLVSESLNINLYRCDFVEEYWNEVFKYFIDEYKKGRTPNPDILCNKYLKFGHFLDYAKDQLNADYIAMGHYAQVRFNSNINEYELVRGIDLNKDQTYFLCQLNQSQLSKTLFPIGNLNKIEVRKIANKLNLVTANKKDSTGICFIGERNFKQFLQNYIPNQPGFIIDVETNKIIGSHIGVMYYTLGQRKGLELGGMPKPYFVVDKDVEHNILYVAANNENDWLLSKSCVATDLNWINTLNQTDFNCTAKFRYRQIDTNVRVKLLANNSALVEYKIPVKAVTPGQEVVFYNKDVCLGGGIIDKVNKISEH